MAKLRHEILAEKLQIKRYFYSEYTTLYMFGFDLKSKEKSFYHLWFSCSFIISLIITMIGTIFFCYSNIQDVDKVVDALGPFLQSCRGVWKFIILYQKRQEIVDLVHRIWQLTENANEAELKILIEANKKSTLLNITYYGFVGATALFGVIFLPFLGALQYILNGKFRYDVTFKATYPIKLEDPFNYVLIYAWNLFASFGLICIVAGLDTLFSWICHNITAQFGVVQHRMKLLTNLDNNRNRNPARKFIVECIAYHQNIIQLADQFNESFRPIAFNEYLTSSIEICVVAFQLGRGVEIARIPFLLSFLIFILIDLLIYSYGGQRLEDESERVASVAFENINWKFWSISECKMMLLATLRAQRASKITAVFFDVNMRSFITVIRTAASYVTLLRSVSNV